MWVGGFVNDSFFVGNGILLIWFVSVGLATGWLAKGALLFVVCCVGCLRLVGITSRTVVFYGGWWLIGCLCAAVF